MNEIEYIPFNKVAQEVSVGSGNGLTFDNLDKETVSIYGDMEISLNGNIQEVEELINIFTKIKNKMELAQNATPKTNNFSCY